MSFGRLDRGLRNRIPIPDWIWYYVSHRSDTDITSRNVSKSDITNRSRYLYIPARKLPSGGIKYLGRKL